MSPDSNVKLRAAIYVRVSTGEQSTSMQRRLLEEFCAHRGWTYLLFEDLASGSVRTRPGLEAMLKEARRRAIDVVVVWKFDRFARSVSHLVSSLEEFKSLGIGFISLTESIDTTTPAGELVFNVIAAIAQFERELIRERIRAGLEHARSRGVKLGRPALDRSMLVEKIAQERQNGKNWGQISRNLGISTRSAKRLILGGGKNSL